MNSEQIKSLVNAQLQGCEVIVEGDGGHYQVNAIGEVFESLNVVKRQQLIYACLNEHIASGEIHALTIKAYTPEEWSKK